MPHGSLLSAHRLHSVHALVGPSSYLIHTLRLLSEATQRGSRTPTTHPTATLTNPRRTETFTRF
jgi:hypothetical protein